MPLESNTKILLFCLKLSPDGRKLGEGTGVEILMENQPSTTL